jgi:hypothetical protein
MMSAKVTQVMQRLDEISKEQQAKISAKLSMTLKRMSKA